MAYVQDDMDHVGVIHAAVPQSDFGNSEDEYIWTESYRRAASQLDFAVNSPTNIVLMLGKSGVGKSRLVEEVVEYVMFEKAVAYFTNPRQLDEDLVETVREAIVGLAECYEQDATPIFIIDDADRLHDDTLSKLIQMSHPNDGGAPVFKLVLVARPGFDEDIQSIVPGATGPAFELWPLDEKEAEAFTAQLLENNGHVGLFDDSEKRKKMLDRAGGYPGALIGAIDWHVKKMDEAGASVTDLKESAAAAPAKAAEKIEADAEPQAAAEEATPTEAQADTVEPETFEDAPAPQEAEPQQADAAEETSDVAAPVEKETVEAETPIDPAPPAPEQTEAEEAQSTREQDVLDWQKRAVDSLRVDEDFEDDQPVAEPVFRSHSAPSTREQRDQNQRTRWEREIESRDDFAFQMQAAEPGAPRNVIAIGLGAAAAVTLFIFGAIGYDRMVSLPTPVQAENQTVTEDVTPVPPVLPVVAGLPEGAREIFRTAIDLGRTDGSAAAAAYAVAAAKGETRAAYYLGQMFETGEGVDRNVAMALFWYEAAAQDIAPAARRAEELRASLVGTAASDGTVMTVAHAHVDQAGSGTFIWSAENAAPETTFEIQFVGDAGEALKTVASDIPAAFSEVPANATGFTVTAINEAGRFSTEMIGLSG